MEAVLLAIFGFFMLLLVVLFFGCESISSLFSDESYKESKRSVTKRRHERLHGTSSSHRL